MKDRLMQIGVLGTAVSALCCFTPFLPWMLSAVGLSGALGFVYRDDVLLPALGLSLLLIGASLWRGAGRNDRGWLGGSGLPTSRGLLQRPQKTL